MSRSTRRILLGILLPMLLLVAVSGWLVTSESGLQVLCRSLLPKIVPGLTFGSVQGRLAGRIRLGDLRYADDRLRLTAGSLDLDWEPAALLHGTFRINALAAGKVRYQQLVAGDNAPVQLPAHLRLPVALDVRDLDVQDVEICAAPGAQPVRLERVSLAGRWQGERLALDRLAVQQATVSVHGTLHLQTAAQYPLSGTLDWQAAVPNQAPLQAHGELSGSLQALHVSQQIGAPYALQLELTLQDLLATPQLDGTLALAGSDLAALHPGWPEMQLHGSVALRGPVQELHIDGSLDLQDRQAGAARLQLAARLLAQSVEFDTLTLTSAGRPLRLNAQGSIGFGAAPVFDFHSTWQALVWPLEGKPDFRSQRGGLELQGTPDHYVVTAHGDVRWLDRLSGSLEVRARSSDQPGTWHIETARLSGGTARVEVSGQAGRTTALQWKIDAPRLGDLAPLASGRLVGSGTLQGTTAHPVLTARLRGNRLRFAGYQADSLELDADLRQAAEPPSHLRLRVRSARAGDIGIPRLELTGAGTPAQHHVHLVADSTRGNADLEVRGDWDGTRWRFDLQRASLGYPDLAPWQLVQPVSGELTRDHLQLPQHCWSSLPARLCLEFAGSATDYRGSFTLTELPLAYVSSLLPATLHAQGEVSGQGQVSAATHGHATLDMRLVTTPVQLGFPDASSTEQPLLRLASGQVVVLRRDRRLSAQVDLPLATGTGGLHLQTELNAPAGGDWLQAALKGDLKLAWPDIAVARNWLPDVAELHGRVDGNVQLTGSVAAPRLLGRVELVQASATLTTPGITLQDVHLALDGQPSGDVRIEAGLRSGDGELQGHGLYTSAQRKASLQLSGTGFQVMHTPEASIVASPDLQVEVTPELASVTGVIQVPHAHLRPSRPPPSAVNVSPDQVIVTGEESGQPAARYPLTSRIRIVLGKDVDIDGLGLRGKLHGDVRVTSLPGQPATASGELSITDGHYQAYGQDLSITTGRLLFAGGAVTAPGIDIEAVRKPAADIQVGVRARGSLQAPQFSVFSTPAMPQSEQLSWLVLGRSMQTGTTDSERSALQSAALMMGLNQGESIGKALGKALGLDEVSVSQEPGADVTTASLLVGKYLTPELFVSYGIGLFEPVSTLNLRFALSSHWKLEGSAAATGSSADLVYEIQRR